MILDYKKGIHPDCGKKVKVQNDIIMTPFYTEKFCDEMVEMANYYDSKFGPNIRYTDGAIDRTHKNSPWQSLYISKISSFMFEEFVQQYKQYLCPIISDIFAPEVITGWFSPFIIKYEVGDKVGLHNDSSTFTMNVKLNTDYEGADLYFPRQDFNNKIVPKGWCIIWPSTVTHPHETKDLTKGKKYTLASWTHPCSWNVNDTGGSILA